MAENARTAMVVLVLAGGVAACGPNASPSPSSPSATQAQAVPPSVQPLASTVVSSISGFVLDTGFRPLPGASIAVVDGPASGTLTTADATGQFSLAGEFNRSTTFRATKDGYVPATQAWNCSSGVCTGPGAARPWLGFYLASMTSPVNMAGDYTLTFIADSACLDLPSELRMRTYAATITPTSRPNIPANTSFKLTVSGASFLANLTGFEIGVIGDYVDLWLDGSHDPPLVEQLAPNTYFALSGNAVGSVGPSPVSSISVSLDGWVDYCVMRTPMGSGYNCGTDNWTGEPIPGQAVTRTHCESANHRLILTRR